jgi:hypothetical protein
MLQQPGEQQNPRQFLLPEPDSGPWRLLSAVRQDMYIADLVKVVNVLGKIDAAISLEPMCRSCRANNRSSQATRRSGARQVRVRTAIRICPMMVMKSMP